MGIFRVAVRLPLTLALAAAVGTVGTASLPADPAVGGDHSTVRVEGRSAPGTSVMDALERQGAADDFQAVSWSLERQYPDSYAGMEYRRDGESTWFGFAGQIPEGALRLIQGLPGPSIVETGEYIPKAQWDKAVESAHTEVKSKTGANVSVGLAPPSRRTFEITVHSESEANSDPGKTDQTASEIESALLAALGSQGMPAGYGLVVSESAGEGQLSRGFV